MASSSYNQLFSHHVKYLGQRYDSNKINSKGDDRTLVRVFNRKTGWHREYEGDPNP